MLFGETTSMCGICGGVDIIDPQATLVHMVKRLQHRGPDDEGFFTNGIVALGHRRLSIIDLSGGHQPMLSPDGSLAIVFNGEIYNYKEVREELIKKGHVFTTQSDTEVILLGYREWGRDCLRHFNGMFAFALWDQAIRKLWLVRDRLGKKPLYYMSDGGRFYFASEAKALWTLPFFKGALDARAMDQYLTYRYVPSERTFYKEIKKLSAGHWMLVDGVGSIERLQPWWELPQSRDEGRGASEADLLRYREEFHDLFSSAVRSRMVADVPVGIFLSSGIDSVSIACEMTKVTPPRAFTLGFNVEGDEVEAARKVAQDLGGQHTGFFLQDKDFDLFPDALSSMDEPYGDPIILPTYVLAREARKSVKVVLTGDGGDELLGGYIHHNFFSRMSERMPAACYKILGNFSRFIPISILDKAFYYPSSMGQAGRARLSQLLSVCPDAYGAYQAFASLFREDERGQLYSSLWKARLQGEPDEFDQKMRAHFFRRDMTIWDKALHWDMKTWFPEQTLMKLDRLTMAHGLEGRCPYADYRLIEFLFRLPFSAFRKLAENKNIVRAQYQSRFPFLSRKKRPFYLPMHKGYVTSFRRLGDQFLNDRIVSATGVFDYGRITSLLKHMHESTLLIDKQIMAIIALLFWLKGNR
ncbi:MAG: asparagine synthase (glutamine-hydrolyzing) [Candidatus Omnitrophica bacterium]|nr:asparagine synthase (glutamine-hydrolyzing) [Candidatus Omnitrophota bacterium]